MKEMHRARDRGRDDELYHVLTDALPFQHLHMSNNTHGCSLNTPFGFLWRLHQWSFMINSAFIPFTISEVGAVRLKVLMLWSHSSSPGDQLSFWDTSSHHSFISIQKDTHHFWYSKIVSSCVPGINTRMCVHACVCVCIDTHTYIYIQKIYIYVHIHICIYIYFIMSRYHSGWSQFYMIYILSTLFYLPLLCTLFTIL